ncbi:TetR/AcrR family transcriptional regulator [Pedobacter hartonius]|uniref:Transcriptional regulator, TetR family n=1 Tax=Pedobacter hartonius TaxID=425514 RepID=A0A1H4CLN1_9SPHI|nr:TetR/AcrR family transcriptional regulator [Pedobacter hartonius]SEA61244.1 transcriptional regulator, TetR family [Pedobacter hartonius]
MPRIKEFDYEQKLEIARNLFWEKGYHATSMNDLVDTLKLNRSSIYDTYGNKHSFFIKCLNSYIHKREEEYKAMSKKGNSPLESVRLVIKNVVKDMVLEAKTCMSVKTTFELGKTDEETQALLNRQAKTSVKLFSSLLQQAKEKGELAENKDPEMIAHFIVASFSSLWNADILFKDKKLTQKLTDHLISTINT